MIDKIFYMGYVDDEQKQLMIKLKSYLSQSNDSINNVSNMLSQANNDNLSQTPQMQTMQSQQGLNSVTPPIDQTKIVFDPKKDEIFNSIPNQE